MVVKHRNTVPTWSAEPILCYGTTSYDFSLQASTVYGENQNEVESGVYAFYQGDLNQDESIDAFDYLVLEPDIQNGIFGFSVSDINGDGVVDSFDYLMLEQPLLEGITTAKP